MKNSPYNKMGECESQKREGYGRDDYLSLPCSNALYMRGLDKNGREGGIFCRNLKKMRIARTLNALSKYVKYNPNSPNSR